MLRLFSAAFARLLRRDESRRIAAAGPPPICRRFSPDPDARRFIPAEPGGGSWIGVNDAGLTLALINWICGLRRTIRRRSREPRHRACHRCSQRGVRGSAGAPSRAAEARHGAISSARFRAARTEGASSFAGISTRSTNCRTRGSRGIGFLPATMSRAPSTSAGGSPAKRGGSRAGSLPWLRRLHGSHEPARGPFCFCMHRERCGDGQLHRSRRDPPRRHDALPRRPALLGPHPRTTHKISLQAACKESALIPTNQQPETTMKTTNPRFNRLVARYYPAVFHLAATSRSRPMKRSR